MIIQLNSNSPRKKQKSLSGESPGKFNQWIRRPRLGSPTIHGCCSILVAKERKVLRALFLIAFLFFCIALSSAYHRPIVEEGRIEKWNFLMILHSPALLLTADVEDGRLEIGFIVSWGLFIPLLLISQKVRFLDPLKEKNFENLFLCSSVLPWKWQNPDGAICTSK